MFELKQLNVVVDYSVGWVSATNINICHRDPDSVLLQRERSGSWIRRISLQPGPRSRSKGGDLGVKIDPSLLLPLGLDLVRKSELEQIGLGI